MDNKIFLFKTNLLARDYRARLSISYFDYLEALCAVLGAAAEEEEMQ